MARMLGQTGPFMIKALLNIMIADIIQFINVGKTMDGGQLVETVDLAIKHYHHFKPEDFKLCLEGVKMGKYGPLYDRIDGQVILSWFGAYDKERDYVAAEHNYNQNELYKQAGNKVLLPERVSESDPRYCDEVFKKNIEKLNSDLAERKAAREAEKQKVQQAARARDPVTEMHQGWIKQFNRIRMKNSDVTGFVKRYQLIANPFYRPGGKEPKRVHRRFDINEYLEHKQWQYMLALTPREKRMKFYLKKY